MKILTLVLSPSVSGAAFAADAPPANASHRYVIERTFPRGALDLSDTAASA